MAQPRYSETDYRRAEDILCGCILGNAIDKNPTKSGYNKLMRNRTMADANNVLFWKEMEEDEAEFRKRRSR